MLSRGRLATPLSNLLLLICALLFGPGPSALEAQAPPTQAALALRHLGDLRDGRSLAAWMAEHRDDRITTYAPRSDPPTLGDWCVRAASEVELSGERVAVRLAYFYPPSPPDPPVLPGETSPERLRDGCRLGFVWIEVQEEAGEEAAEHAGQVSTELFAALGAPDTGSRVHWWGAGSWSEVARWEAHEVIVAVAAATGPRWGERAEESSPRTLALASGPFTGIPHADWRSGPALPRYVARQARRDLLVSRVDEAIGLVEAPERVERPMRAMLRSLEEVGWSRFASEEERAALVDALSSWLAHAAGLEPGRRAAALLTADLFPNHFMGGGLPGDTSVLAFRDRLDSLGAEFEFAPLGAAWVYTRNWLKNAHELDPHGRAGELAFLTLMELGFETSGTCRDRGPEAFREVIRQGEAFLEERPDSPIRSRVRLMLAEAYGDIVTLAEGGTYDPSEADAYVEEAEHARTRAIEEYRVALERGAGAGLAGESWAAAWRLLAGLPPTRTFFYCIYD